MVAIFTGNGLGLAQGSANILGGAGQLGSAGLGRGGEQVSVNAATGNLVIARQDEFLVGIGVNASVSRVFNSQATASDDRDNSDRWQQSTTRRVFGLTGTANTTGSTLQRQDADGSIISYTYGARGGVSAYWTTKGSGAHDKIVQSGANWVWTDGESQVSETYSLAYGSTTDYRIVSATTLTGKTLTITYNANSNLVDKIITHNPGGRSDEYLKYHWSGTTITRIETGYVDIVGGGVDRTMSVTHYEYTGGRLSKVRTDFTPSDHVLPTDGQSYWTSYGYDASGRVNLITQKDGSSLTIGYDGSGRVTTLTQKETATVDRVTSLMYNAGNTQIIAPYPAGGSAADYTTTLYYDASNQLTKIKAPPASAGATQQEVIFTYDADGNVDTVTNADGEVTDYDYDTFGNVTKTTRVVAGGTNIVVDRLYDSNNRLTRESWTSVFEGESVASTQYKRYVYGTSGALEWEIDADGLVREYVISTETGTAYLMNEYVGHTYTTGSTVPTAAAMATWRSGLGDISNRRITWLGLTNRGGMSSSYTWKTSDAAGNISWAEAIADYYAYDQAGRLTWHARPDENQANMGYDSLGRMTASSDKLGGTTYITFNDTANTTVVTTSLGYISTSTYNLAGELIAQTGNVAGSSSSQYDKQGRLRTYTDEAGGRTYYLYDKAGRLTAEVSHGKQLIEYRYDQANRLIATIRYGNPVSDATIGNLQDPNHTWAISDIRPAGGGFQTDVWSWTVYDNAGRVVQTINGEGEVVEFEYDTAGNVLRSVAYFNKVATAALKTTPPLAKVTVTANSAKDAVTRNFYDRSGRLRGTLNGEGYLTETVYNRAGQAVEVIAYAAKANSTLWATGTLASLRNDVGANSAANRRTRNIYDNTGNLTYQLSYVSRSGSNDVWQVTEMTYDNKLRLVDTKVRANTLTISNSAPNFALSAVAALITASGNDRVTSNTYHLSSMVASTTAPNGLTTWFTYDVAGNVTKTVTGTGPDARTTRNYYASSGHLLYSVDAAGFVTQYTYDNEGKVIFERRYDAAQTFVSDSTTMAQLQAALASVAYVERGTAYSNDDMFAAATVRASTEGTATTTNVAYYYGLKGQSYVTVRSPNVSQDYSHTWYFYDAAGRIQTEAPAYGDILAATVYTYDGQGNRSNTSVYQNAVYLNTAYEYDRRGLLTKVTDAAGGITTYEYNAFGELVKSTDARGNSSYSYYDNLGRVTQTIDAENYATTTSYNRFGDVLNVRRYTGTFTGASVTSMPAVSGTYAETSFTYNAAGQLTQTTTMATATVSYYEKYTYTQFGERATSTTKSETANAADGDNNLTTYTYDKRGLLLSVLEPAMSVWSGGVFHASVQKKTSYTYDARGNRKTMVEADGWTEARTTKYDYDKFDRLTKTTADNAREVYDQSNHLSLSTTFKPEETYLYDERGNLTTTTDAMGNRSVFYYDDLDRKVAEIDVGGTYTAYSYDGVGNVLSIKVYETLVTTIPAEGGSAAEGAALVPSGAFRETRFAYDNLNRMTKSIVVLASGYNAGSWNGSSWATASLYDSTFGTYGLVTSYEYDAMGNVVKTTDPNGNAIYAYYDKVGRKVAQLDGEKYLTTWAYNAEGNVHTETRYATQFTGSPVVGTVPSVGTNGADRITTYTYDYAGNRLTETRKNVVVHNSGTPGTSTTQDATITYTYNGLGQVITRTEATGDATSYVYDNVGRLTTETKPGYVDQSNTTVTPQLTYTYDAHGNLKQLTAAGSANATARVTSYTYDAGGLLSSMVDAEGDTTYYRNDRLGRTIAEEYTRTIASSGQVKTEGKLTSFDKKGQVTEQAVAEKSGTWTKSLITRMTYNAFGDVVTTGVVGNAASTNVQQTNKYDLAGRLWATNSGDGIWKYFGYDRNGNQTIAVASAGADMAGIAANTANTFFELADFAGAQAISQATVNATYTVYNARNLATQVVEEGRQVDATDDGVTNTAANTLTSARSYNAFGEVASETDARLATLSYTYNTMGKVIRSEGPTVQMTPENGSAAIWIRPTQDFYYDKSGRLVAQRDANGTYAATGNSTTGASKDANTGNLTLLTLLAGTGYGGGEALVTKTVAADGGVTRTGYDIHGNARTTDVLVTGTEASGTWRTTTRSFDLMGNLTQQNNAGGLIDYYDYDELGQRTKHWNNFLYDTETTNYDVQGRVTSQTAFGGVTTSYSYVWNSTIAASGSGLSNTGGWTQTTTMANTRTLVETSDIFGHITQKTDLGYRTTYYTYDVAGRVTSTSVGSSSTTLTYFNTGKLNTLSAYDAVNYTTKLATYSYDQAGNRRTEVVTDAGSQIKNNTVVYDLLGRMKSITAAGTTIAPAASNVFEYDANGNIRKKVSSYYELDANGNQSTARTDTGWFRYDSMNRVVVDNGQVVGGVIVRRAFDVNVGGIVRSHEYLYNRAGERTLQTITEVYNDGKSPPWGGYNMYTEEREYYTYDAAGRLTQTKVSRGTQGMTDPPAAAPAEGSATLRSSFGYDLMGRQTSQTDYAQAGVVTYSSTSTYNAQGQVATQTTSTKKTDGKTYGSTTTFSYGTVGYADYALGAQTRQDSDNSVNGGNWTYTRTDTTYGYWDGAVQTQIMHDKKRNDNGNTPWYTYFTVTDFGATTFANIQDERPRYVYFKLDELGQILRRDETRPSQAPASQVGSPHEVWYRLGEREWGYAGNNGTLAGSTSEAQFQRTIYTDPAQTGTFRFGSMYAKSSADFTRGPGQLNTWDQGSRAGGYTVRNGDTLQSIAQGLYGDGSLWYKIAEANGLSSASATLTAGQQLQLPAGVARSTYNSKTYAPYDPANAMGDLSPTSPKKPPKCGVMGMILVAAVAIGLSLWLGPQFIAAAQSVLAGGAAVGAGVVTAAAGSAAAIGGGIVGGAITGAVTSIASQGFGVATGLQDKFSWKAVGMSAVAAGVSGGLGAFAQGAAETAAIAEKLGKGVSGLTKVGAFLGNGSALSAGVNGALGSALTQGIGVATGLQNSFSFTGVAAAGLGAAAGTAAGQGFANLTGTKVIDGGWGGFAASTGANALASAATRSALTGTSFGQSLVSSLPDIVSQAVGRVVHGALAGGGQRGLSKEAAATVQAKKMKEMVAATDAASGAIERKIAQIANAMSVNSPTEEQELQWDDGSQSWRDGLEALAARFPGNATVKYASEVTVPDVVLEGGALDGLSLPEELAEGRLRVSNICETAGSDAEELYDMATGRWTTCGEIADTRATSVSNRLAAWGVDDPEIMSRIANNPAAAFMADRALLAFLETEAAAVGRAPSNNPFSVAAKFGLSAGGSIALGSALLLSSDTTEESQTLMCQDIGSWITDPGYQSYSLNAQSYQDFIGGRVGQNFQVTVSPSVSTNLRVNFDGCLDTPAGPELREAKASYRSLLDPMHNDWSKAPGAVEAQGYRQIGALTELMARHPGSSISLNWYTQTQADQGYISSIFGRSAIPITVNHFPMPEVPTGR